MEDNLKRLVSETTRLCREAGMQLEPHVIAYLAALQDATKAWEESMPGTTLGQPMEPTEIAAIGELLFKQIAQQGDATVATARLQIMMEVGFRQQREKVEAEQAERNEGTGMLARAVTNPRPVKDSSMPSYEKFYKRVLEYVSAQAGLERAANDAAASEEVRAAMESVFPLSTLARFLTLSENEKLQQVEELSRITLGICLYNRACGKGGHALPAGSASYIPQASHLLRALGRHIEDAGRDTAALSAAVVSLPEQRQRAARQELMFRAQALVLLESLQADLEAGLDATQQLEGELQHLVTEAQDAVGSSSAVSKDAVFPIFDRMGTMHLALADELRLLVVRQRLFDRLMELQSNGPSSVLRGLPRTVGAGASSAEAERSRAPTPQDLPEGVAYVHPSSSSLLDAQVALSGFCPVSLAEGRGLLKRANPALGYLRFEEQLLGFCSREAMARFLLGPAEVMQAAGVQIDEEPVLARLTGTPSRCPHLDLNTIMTIMSAPLKVDFGCQTPVHFLERHVDVNYEWNEWALRRRALALANLRNKKTHSTQTAKTHFKRDGETQVWVPKVAEVQTRVNKGQAMPKKLQYVAGLRGAPNVKMNVVRLDLDLGQPHQL